MNNENIKILIISIGIISIIAIIVFILNRRIKGASLKIGEIEGKFETHEDSEIKIADIEQIAPEGENEARLVASNVALNNVKQNSRNKNTLDIKTR